MPDPLKSDVEVVGRISAVPSILRTMRLATGLRFTFIARVTATRWMACAVHDELSFGVAVGQELDVSTTLCSEVRDARLPIAIDHASTDKAYGTHPTPKMYGFESYLSVPIFRKSGEYFGTICGLDPEPHVVSDEKTVAMVQLFAELISTQLDVEERQDTYRAELEEQRETARLREQFIAVLGHDVRGPLSSIVTGTELLFRRIDSATERRVLERMRASSRRITSLVDDLMDLARGRLGGGIGLEITTPEDLRERLCHVVAEVEAAHPSRTVRLSVSFEQLVQCDARRIEQLLWNLLANAVAHGRSNTPIGVTLLSDEQTFSIAVSNEGDPIPEEKRKNLFEPYFRGGEGHSDGLGLGLYIVSEIAKAHHGTVVAQSSAERTSFTFEMPRISDAGASV